MLWYVFLITIPAVFFLGQVAVELIGHPIRTILRLRQDVLERLLAFRNVTLPRPRETAVTSQQIREHDWAMRNVRAAEHTFGDLGAQLIAFGETEPAICALMALCGQDVVLAGHELINLSQVYAAAKSDSDEVRRAIEEAHHAAGCAVAGSRRHPDGDNLIRIRLEPMRLRDAASPRLRKRAPGNSRAAARRTHARAATWRSQAAR